MLFVICYQLTKKICPPHVGTIFALLSLDGVAIYQHKEKEKGLVLLKKA